MPSIQQDPEERVVETPFDDVVERAAGLSDVQRAVPLSDRGEIRADEAVDVIADPRGQHVGALDDEPGTTVEGAPDPEGDGERVARFDPAIAGAEQAEGGAGSGRQHQVTGQRRAVPAEERHRVALTSPGTQSPDERQDAVRRRAGGRLHRRELFELVDHAETVGRVDQQVVGVLDHAAWADEPAQLIGEERRDVEHRAVGIRLPPDDADTRRIGDALVAKDLGEWPRAITRLVRQAEVLESVPAHRQRGRAGRPVALVPDEDRRLAARPDDQDRLLEARVEPGQPRHVRAVLAIGVDDDTVVSGTIHPLAEPLEADCVQGGRDLGRPGGPPERGQLDVGQAREWGGSGGGHLPYGAMTGDVGSTALAPRRTVTTPPASAGSQGPTSPSGQVTCTSAFVALPMPKCSGTSWPLTWPPPTVSSRCRWRSPARTATHAPIASWFDASWSSVTPSQSPIGFGVAPSPAPTLRQSRTFARRTTCTMSGRPSALRSATAAPRAFSKSTIPAASPCSTNVPSACPISRLLGSSMAFSSCDATFPFVMYRSEYPSSLTSSNAGCHAVDASATSPVYGRCAVTPSVRAMSL